VSTSASAVSQQGAADCVRPHSSIGHWRPLVVVVVALVIDIAPLDHCTSGAVEQWTAGPLEPGDYYTTGPVAQWCLDLSSGPMDSEMACLFLPVCPTGAMQIPPWHESRPLKMDRDVFWAAG